MPSRPRVPKSRYRPGAAGSCVRRKDSAGRTYYLDRETGKRTNRATWELSRETISFERVVSRDRPQDFAPGTPSRPGSPGKAPETGRTGQRPFPPGVTPRGRPEAGGSGSGGGGGGGRGRRDRDEDEEDFGEDWDDGDYEPFEVDGEDDTGGPE